MMEENEEGSGVVGEVGGGWVGGGWVGWLGRGWVRSIWKTDCEEEEEEDLQRR